MASSAFVSHEPDVEFSARIFSSLSLPFFADSIALPVHWYYSLDTLKDHYPQLYSIPFPLSSSSTLSSLFLSISSSAAHPDSFHYFSHLDFESDLLDIYGPNRRKLYAQAKKDGTPTNGAEAVHYHAGLQRGDNTLNYSLLLQFLRTASDTCSLPERALSYAQFFLSPQLHHDVYIASAHRFFFQQLSRAVSLHSLALDDPCSTGILLSLPLLIKLFFDRSGRRQSLSLRPDHRSEWRRRLRLLRRHLYLTHASPVLWILMQRLLIIVCGLADKFDCRRLVKRELSRWMWQQQRIRIEEEDPKDNEELHELEEKMKPLEEVIMADELEENRVEEATERAEEQKHWQEMLKNDPLLSQTLASAYAASSSSSVSHVASEDAHMVCKAPTRQQTEAYRQWKASLTTATSSSSTDAKDGAAMTMNWSALSRLSDDSAFSLLFTLR